MYSTPRTLRIALGMSGVDLDFSAQPGDAQVDAAIERIGLAMGGDLQQAVAHQRPSKHVDGVVVKSPLEVRPGQRRLCGRATACIRTS
jgi:hypothetical protein